jgi:predicted double-glycine peptidase
LSRAAWAGALFAGALAGSTAPAAATQPDGAKAVASLTALRDAGVVRQHWDISCGAAAIATLMTYQLGRPVTEREVALGMLHRTNPYLVRMRLGFSLLDLKRFAVSRGLASTGWANLTLDEALDRAPLITPIRTHGFRHFVVLRGRSGDRVLLADPAFGNRTMRVELFETAWAGGLGFVVYDPAEPHPPNRMGAPPSLFMTAPASAVRTTSMETRIRGGF